MIAHDTALRAYARVLSRAAGGTVRSIASQLDLPRRASAEVYAATAALVPAGLARRTHRRPENTRAAMEVVKKFGRPADVGAPELGIASRVDRDDLSPRLGGLLGDAGPRLATWIAERTRAEEEPIGRAIAVTAPIVLGALDLAFEPRDLGDWISVFPDADLDDPAGLLEDEEAPGLVYRRLVRHSRPWWRRWSGPVTG